MKRRKIEIEAIICFLLICMTYFTAGEDLYMCTSRKIKIINTDSWNETTILSKNSQFLGFAVDLGDAKIYYADVADDTLGIYRMDLNDSSTESRIISYNQMTPVGLAVDWVFKHLYWTDMQYRSAMVSNLDGSSKITLATEGLSMPRGIAVEPDNIKLYWTEGCTTRVISCNLDGTNCRRDPAVSERNMSLFGITSTQTDSYYLSNPSEFLLYTNVRSGEVGISNPKLGFVNTLIKGGVVPLGLAYDPVKQDVYFSDAKVRAIYSCKLDGSEVRVLLNSSHGISYVEGLAIDFKQRRLYFTNTGYSDKGDFWTWGNIEMVDLQDVQKRRRILRNLHKPRSIVIDSDNRTLYYTVWGETNPHVGRVRLDGYNRQTLYEAVNPKGMIILGGRLYVTDSRNHSSQSPIMISSDLDGSNRVDISIPKLGNIYSISKFENNLLITDSEGRTGIYSTSGVLQSRIQYTGYTDMLFTKRSKDIQEGPSNSILFADVDGIMMVPLDRSGDDHIYNIIPSSSVCGDFHGLAKDDNNIYFSSYYGQTIFRASLDGSDVVEFYKTDHKLISLAILHGTLYWTGITDKRSKKGGIYSTSISRPATPPEEFVGNLDNPYYIDVSTR
ncbi:hypothetical protein FSP39_016743 [Pinctada imbricata]|uniref:Uncharacterized protein n=1 Tax=Pinctada imbricata TaxID=66713 RepID=A0AA88YJQ4_PINIB|nr:hypothetical protein FSP39_016743 [Pinctada imbricata]